MKFAQSEELGDPALTVAGFQLWVHGRQLPNSDQFWDANWLRVTAHSGAPGADVWVSGALLMVTDLVGFAQDCDALVNGQKRLARLEPLEPELRVRIRQADNLGHLSMQVEITPDHLTQAHSFEYEIDQTYLPAIARSCREVVRLYPVLGSGD